MIYLKELTTSDQLIAICDIVMSNTRPHNMGYNFFIHAFIDVLVPGSQNVKQRASFNGSQSQITAQIFFNEVICQTGIT